MSFDGFACRFIINIPQIVLVIAHFFSIQKEKGYCMSTRDVAQQGRNTGSLQLHEPYIKRSLSICCTHTYKTGYTSTIHLVSVVSPCNKLW